MKAILFLLLFSTILFANPIDNTPITRFSELTFNNSQWTLELVFPFPFQSSIPDSIILEVNNTRTRVNVFLNNIIQMVVITNDSLSIPITLNRAGGKIHCYTYSYSIFYNEIIVREDSLSWGNNVDATVGEPLEGQSICRFFGEIRDNDWQIDYIENNPSIGLTNDTTSSTAIMRGTLYDIYGNPVTHIKTGGYYFQFESDLVLSPDGSFTTKLFNTLYHPGILFIKMQDFQIIEDTAKIDSVVLPNFNAGSLVTNDIHINEQCNIIITDIKNEVPFNYDIELINYPNPFNSSTNFVVRIPNEIKWNEMDIKIYNSNGQLIKVFALNGSNEICWDGTDMRGVNVTSGAYYYSLNIDNRQIKNGSMILLK